MQRFSLAIGLLWAALSAPAAAQALAAPTPPDDMAVLLRMLEEALESGDPAQYVRLLSPLANREEAVSFAAGWFESGITRAVVRERDRQPLAGTFPGAGHELNVDVFTEFGRQARLGTWRLDLRHTGSPDRGEPAWQISGQSELSIIDGLFQLQLDKDRQFVAQNLAIRSEDFELKMPLASLFVADIPDGTTAVVALGRGEMVFAPPIAAERRQVKIFSGNEVLQTRVDAAFVRLNPNEALERISGMLQERVPDPRDLRRASEIFQEQIRKSFGLDMRDLSPQLWSTIPVPGDFVAEVRTSRYDILTYARLSADPEDVSLFDRRRRRSISLYPSRQKLAQRGPFYSEDDLVDYDVLDYNVESSFVPDREWLEGKTTLKLRIKSSVLSNLRLRLASDLTLRSVFSPRFGRLLALRELSQDTVIVNLPGTVPRGAEIELVISYAGRLQPQQQTREAIAMPAPQNATADETLGIPREPSWIYSNNSYWYAQATVSDYATARLQLAVPDGYESVASGAMTTHAQLVPLPEGAKGLPWRQSSFVAAQPVRYLSWLISRLDVVDRTTASVEGDPAAAAIHTSGRPNQTGGAPFQRIDILVEANPRQVNHARDLSPRTAAILKFYASLLGGFPYPAFTLAVVESELPGGHSPPYFVQLKEPPAFGPFIWRSDPVYFGGFPDFFLAHEVAHQWWGQAIGWKNFHEQWLSEGFAQYFALLYAERQRPDAFGGVLRQLRRWSMDESEEGPVYLGYRLGHIKGDGRVFRALVYNKGAAVLHMLRRLVGDDAFFRSLRRFYSAWLFQKASTEDLRAVFEVETHRPLDKFFAGWIYGQDIPRIRFAWSVDGQNAVLRFEQLGEDTFVLPVTVSLQLADRTSHDQIVTIDEKNVEVRVPFTGTLRSIDLNRDDAALAEFVR